MNSILAILALYSPIVFLIIGLIAIFKSKNNFETGIPVNLGIFSFAIPIKNKVVAKGLLSSLIIISTLAYYLFILDLSWFYPREMSITVHYNDEQGLIDLVNEINIEKIGVFPIVVEDKDSRMKYFVDGDTTINKYLNYEDYYTDVVVNRKYKLETSGKATFEVSKIKGIHTYQITNSSGELEHTKFLKEGTQKLRSKFDHVKSPYDKIRVSKPKELFRKVITPEFRQALLKDANVHEMLDHTLYGVTVLYPLPLPTYSNTLYLYEKNGKMIPIGYAVYY